MQNHIGTTVGGPASLPKLYNGKNKTFFFFAYEAYREPRASPTTRTVMTPSAEQGLFTYTPAGSGAPVTVNLLNIGTIGDTGIRPALNPVLSALYAKIVPQSGYHGCRLRLRRRRQRSLPGVQRERREQSGSLYRPHGPADRPEEFASVPRLPPVGALWFVNLVNFMDGLDWMTVAEVVPLTATLAVIGLFGMLPPAAIIVSLALCGAMIGFAYFNGRSPGFFSATSAAFR